MSLPEGTSSIWSTWAPRSREPSRRPPSCSRLDRPNASPFGGQSSQSTLKPWLEGDETIWNHISGTIEWESLILGWDKFLDKVGWSISAKPLWLLHPTSTDSHSQLSGQHPLQYPDIPKMAFQFTGDQPKVPFFGAKHWSPNRSNCAMAWGPPSYQRVHDVSLSHALGWDGGSQGAMAIWDGWHQQLKMVKISHNGGNMWKCYSCYRLGDGTISSHSNHLSFDGHVVKELDEKKNLMKRTGCKRSGVNDLTGVLHVFSLEAAVSFAILPMLLGLAVKSNSSEKRPCCRIPPELEILRSSCRFTCEVSPSLHLWFSWSP